MPWNARKMLKAIEFVEYENPVIKLQIENQNQPNK
jgi:hypothetical protein